MTLKLQAKDARHETAERVLKQGKKSAQKKKEVITRNPNKTNRYSGAPERQSAGSNEVRQRTGKKRRHRKGNCKD